MSANRRSLLESCNVPSYIYNTSLPKEGAQSLREWVESAQYVTDTSYVGLSLFPKHIRDYPKTRRVFHTLAKEVCLHSKGQAVCITLLTLNNILFADKVTENQDEYVARARTAPMLFISDFYENGAPPPFSPYQSVVIRDFLKTAADNGTGIFTLSDARVFTETARNRAANAACEWWPSSTLQLISKRTIAKGVE